MAGGVYYFHLSPKHVGVGAGLYGPGPEELLAVRTMLAERHQDFRKLAKTPEKVLGKLHGDATVRMPKGFDPSSPAAICSG